MPSSTPERQARWEGHQGAMGFLKGCGYRLTHDWMWHPPALDRCGDKWIGCSPMEADAIIYLIEEWDFGGLIDPSDRKSADRIPWLAKDVQAEG